MSHRAENETQINGLVEDSAMELVKHLEKSANSEINIRELVTFFETLSKELTI